MDANYPDTATSRILCLSSGDEYLVSEDTAEQVKESEDEWITIDVLESNGAQVEIRPEHVVAIEPVPEDYFESE